MKKIFVILIGVFLLTGCNAEYTITIDKDIIKDDVFIYDKLSKYETLEQERYAENTLADFQMGYEFYDKTFSLRYVQEAGYHFTTYLKYDEYDSLSIVRKCYDDIKVTTETSLKISTTSQFLCFDYYDDLETVKINLKTKYKVINTNADSVDNNVYTWNINKENSINKPIYLELNPGKNNSKIIVIILVGVIVLFVSGFIIKLLINLTGKNRF